MGRAAKDALMRVREWQRIIANSWFEQTNRDGIHF
jgi:hypothetical protein